MEIDVLQMYEDLMALYNLPEELQQNINPSVEVAEKLSHSVCVYIDSYNVTDESLREALILSQLQLILFAYIDSHSADIKPIHDLLDYCEGILSNELTLKDLVFLAGLDVSVYAV